MRPTIWVSRLTVVIAALTLGACTAELPVQAIAGAECKLPSAGPLSERLALSEAFRAKALARRDPTSIAFNAAMEEFGAAVRQRTSGLRPPTAGEYAAALEATMVGWELKSGVSGQEAVRIVRGKMAMGLADMGSASDIERVRQVRDSLLAFEGVGEYVESMRALRVGRLPGGFSLVTDTTTLFRDIDALAAAVGDTTMVGTATLANSQAEYVVRAPEWSDTTLARQFADVHVVFDTLRLFLDDMAFAAWLADTTNLIPVYSRSAACGTPRSGVAQFRAQQCAPCWAIAMGIVRSGAIGAAAGVITEIWDGITSGDGGGTEAIVSAAAFGAASSIALHGYYRLLIGPYGMVGYTGIAAAMAVYFWMNGP